MWKSYRNIVRQYPRLSLSEERLLISKAQKGSKKSKDEIIVTQARNRFLLAQNPQQGQWRLLNAKLHWGASPHYNRHPEIKGENNELSKK